MVTGAWRACFYPLGCSYPWLPQASERGLVACLSRPVALPTARSGDAVGRAHPSPPLTELASSCRKLEQHAMGQTLLEEKGTSTQQSGPAVPSPGQPQAWSDSPGLGSGYRFY